MWLSTAIISLLSRTSETQPTVILGILGLLGFLSSAISSYLIYSLVNRRNTHFAREEILLGTSLEAAKSRSPAGDLKALLPLSSAQRGLGELNELGGERSAFLWALLTLIPYAGWVAMIYVLSFLSGDLRNHESHEDMVVQDLERTMKATGGSILPTRYWRTPGRSIAAFALLSIITLGMFELVWLYLAIEDPRAHFEYHRSFEEPLLGTL